MSLCCLIDSNIMAVERHRPFYTRDVTYPQIVAEMQGSCRLHTREHPFSSLLQAAGIITVIISERIPALTLHNLWYTMLMP